MSVYEKMTALADAIREKTGITDKLSLDGMTQAVKRLYGLIVSSATGNPLVLNDSTNLRVRSFKLYGRTTQDGIPTPEAPVPLVSAADGGSLGVTVAGKNLLPNNATAQTIYGVQFTVDSDGIITANGTATDYSDLYFYGSSTDKGEYLHIPKGCKFAIGDSEINNLWLCREKTKGAVVGVNNINSVLAVQDCYFYGVALRVEKGKTVSNLATYAGFYALGVDTSYEPYKEQTLTVSTPNGLPGIPVSSGGNYTDENGQQWVCDEVDFTEGVYVQRVYHIPLTANLFSDIEAGRYCPHISSCQLRVVNEKTTITFNPSPSIAGANGTGQQGSVMMSTFSNAIGSFADAACVMWENGTNNLYQCNIAFSTDYVAEATEDAFVEFFTAHPGEILIGMHEPIETALSAELLDSYAALHTNYPNTTIINDGGAGMEVSYVADTKNYIDNQIAAMSAAIVNS